MLVLQQQPDWTPCVPSPSEIPEPNELYATTLTWSLTALFQSPDLMIELNSETVEQARANRGTSIWS